MIMPDATKFKAQADGPGSLAAGGDSVPNNTTPTKNPLWEAQQAHLSKLRYELPQVAADFKAGLLTEAELKGALLKLAGKLHAGTWRSLIPSFAGLGALPRKFRLGTYILGGWHSDGSTSQAARPTVGLLRGLADYRAVLRAEALRQAVVTAEAKGGSVLADAQVELGVHLALNRHLFQGIKWSKNLEIINLIKRRAESVTDGIENLLLFMDVRVFVFEPSAEEPALGCSDFVQFANTYSQLNFDISKFGVYYWGFYPSWH